MDFIGPLPESNKFKSILNIIDRATNFAVSIPTETQTAEELISKVQLHYLAMFGIPKYLLLTAGLVSLQQFLING